MRSKINPRVLYLHMQKETIPCSVCGSENFVEISDHDRYRMGLITVICRHCGFEYTNPRPTQEEMNRFYRESYRGFYTHNINPANEHRDPSNIIKRQWFFDRAKPNLLGMNIRQPFILDVGCGSGVLLSVVRKNIPEGRLFGIEPFDVYAKFTQKKSDASVYSGDLDSYLGNTQQRPGPFHLITLYHVLEHLYNPVEKLLRLRDLLSEEGLILIQVPNAASPYWHNTAEKYHIAHVNHFSPRTLRLAMERAGFKVVKTFAGSHPGNPRAVTLLGRRTREILPKDEIRPLPPHQLKTICRTIRRINFRSKKTPRMGGKFIQPARGFAKMGRAAAEFGTAYAAKQFTKKISKTTRRSLSFLKSAAIRAYQWAAGPTVRYYSHRTCRPALQKLIEGRKILIIGSGPSAAGLKEIPPDMKVFTCNAGPRLFLKNNLRSNVDLFLCRRKAMTEDYTDIEELLQKIKTDIFVMDDLSFVKQNRKLDGTYRRLLKDHQKDNYYLEKLIQPLKLQDIKADNVTWTSAGVRLLQYALYFNAKEIYLIGVDLSHSGYFWGEKNRYRHSGARIRHKHPIDHNFLKLVAKRYRHVYSMSSASPLTRYLPYKDPLESIIPVQEPLKIEPCSIG